MALALFALTSTACTVREHRPEGPYRQAEEFVDALSDQLVACLRERAPQLRGEVVIAAELRGADKAPVIHDAGSTPGTESVLECVREHAAELSCPAIAPAQYARVSAPVPLNTSGVKYVFVHDLSQ
ncbi:MAG TPA: hypothetical protein VJR89_12320 [Polyangiales bacterium]|nr:hypothetical protein [Polyangiales bacterium]